MSNSFLDIVERLDKAYPEAHLELNYSTPYICQAKKPKCSECVVSDLCLWPEKEQYN